MRGMEAESTSDVCEPANPVQIRLELRCDVLRTSHDYVCSYSRSCAMRAHLVDRLWGQRAMGGGAADAAGFEYDRRIKRRFIRRIEKRHLLYDRRPRHIVPGVGYHTRLHEFAPTRPPYLFARRRPGMGRMATGPDV